MAEPYMPLPLVLAASLDEALAEMRGDPLHALKPIRRLAIYEAFDPQNDRLRRRVLSYLAIMTARHVLPIWQDWLQSLPYERLSLAGIPERMLELAAAVMQGAVDAETAQAEAIEAHERLGRPCEISKDEFREDAHLAGYVAVNALHTVLGMEPFEDLDIGEHTTDEGNLNGYESSTDTASPASNAYAGIRDNPGYDGVYAGWAGVDPATRQAIREQMSAELPSNASLDEHGTDSVIIDTSKRQEFWTWWLTEAIPQAWQATLADRS